jgi:DNA-binding NtrC family response regulator
MKILLVDDEVELITALAERLSLRGFRTACAYTGDEAIELVRKESFRVAILDVKMPGLSGVDLMNALRKIQPSLQIIFVTGHGSENDYRECSRRAWCETIIKPIKIDELVEQIENAGKNGEGDRK